MQINGNEIAKPKQHKRSLYALKKAMENEPGLMDGSIGISIEGNKAVLAGTVQSKAYMDKVVNLIKGDKQLSNCENYLVIAKSVARQDHSLARHIKSVLQSYFIDSKIYVSVIYDKAIVFGKVNSKEKRKLIENTVKKHFSYISTVENHVLAA